MKIRTIVKVKATPDNVTKPFEANRIVGLTRTGALVRAIARRLMKKPTRVKLSDMTPQEREEFKKKQRQARRAGKPSPKRPFAHAKPGKPPFNRNDSIKNNIEFGGNDEGDAVSIGVSRMKTQSVEQLTKGGDVTLPGPGGRPIRMHFRPHPLLEPALDAALPKIPDLFQGIVR